MRGGINPEINTGKSTMHDGKDTNEKAIQVTEHFAETSGIHGIGHIIGRSKLGGTIWSVICLASLGNVIFLDFGFNLNFTTLLEIQPMNLIMSSIVGGVNEQNSIVNKCLCR